MLLVDGVCGLYLVLDVGFGVCLVLVCLVVLLIVVVLVY